MVDRLERLASHDHWSPRRKAGRCSGRHQRARCPANPRVVGKVPSHSGKLCGRSRPSSSTSVDIGNLSRICAPSAVLFTIRGLPCQPKATAGFPLDLYIDDNCCLTDVEYADDNALLSCFSANMTTILSVLNKKKQPKL